MSIKDFPRLEPTLSDTEFTARLKIFHRAVYASEPFVFDDVMTRFWKPPATRVAHDHCILFADGNWHLFVLSRPLEWHHKLVAAVRAGNWERAKQFPYAVGDAHLVGPRLNQLEEVGIIHTDADGEWGTLAQTNSYVHPVDNRWVVAYCSMCEKGQQLCIDWSDDLTNWQRATNNPIWQVPDWAGGTNVCKGPCIVEHDGSYLIYYNLNLRDGTNTVSLISTPDFQQFIDHGPVLRFPNQLRGTMGCESPCVFQRNNIWHIMVTSGDYWWHAISNRPDSFLGTQGIQTSTNGGVYDMGPFHVSKVVKREQHWLMTSSYKAEHRRRCRSTGQPIFRGEELDESGLCEGLFVSKIHWDGDRPVLTKYLSEY